MIIHQIFELIIYIQVTNFCVHNRIIMAMYGTGDEPRAPRNQNPALMMMMMMMMMMMIVSYSG